MNYVKFQPHKNWGKPKLVYPFEYYTTEYFVTRILYTKRLNYCS